LDAKGFKKIEAVLLEWYFSRKSLIGIRANS